VTALAHLFSGHLLLGWLAIGAAFLIVELMSGSGWLLWPAVSAAAVGLVTLLLPMSLPAQAALFAALTIVTTYAGRRWLAGRSRPPGSDVNDARSRLVGHAGRASLAFHDGEGRVFVDGKEWAAEAEPDAAIAMGSRVEVLDIVGGAKLKVRAAPEG
jgi:hypothetical protein